MDKTDMRADLFEIGELIDEANKYEDDLNIAINLVVQLSKNYDDLNDPKFKHYLDNLEKVWNKRKQFDKLRVRLNTIY
jgi:hypothetical protein